MSKKSDTVTFTFADAQPGALENMTGCKAVCYMCKIPLTGGLDTFGEIHWPMCWDCWTALFDDTIRTIGPVGGVKEWWTKELRP